MDEDFADPRKVALRADRLWRDSLQSAMPSSTVISPSTIGVIIPEPLSDLVAPVSRPCSDAPRSDKPHSDRSRPGKQRLDKPRTAKPDMPSTDASDMCWYHRRFGKFADFCRSPCSFSGNGRAGRQ